MVSRRLAASCSLSSPSMVPCRARELIIRSRGVGEVALLVWIEGDVVELVFVGIGLGDGHRFAAAQALVALAGDPPELLVVVVTGELHEVLLAVHLDLGYDRLDVIGLPIVENVRVAARDPLEWAGAVRGALADLIVGHEQDRLGATAPPERPDRAREVAPDQRSRIGVIDLQLGERLVAARSRPVRAGSGSGRRGWSELPALVRRPGAAGSRR